MLILLKVEICWCILIYFEVGGGEVARGGGDVVSRAFWRTKVMWLRDGWVLGDQYCLDKCLNACRRPIWSPTYYSGAALVCFFFVNKGTFFWWCSYEATILEWKFLIKFNNWEEICMTANWIWNVMFTYPFRQPWLAIIHNLNSHMNNT